LDGWTVQHHVPVVIDQDLPEFAEFQGGGDLHEFAGELACLQLVVDAVPLELVFLEFGVVLILLELDVAQTAAEDEQTGVAQGGLQVAGVEVGREVHQVADEAVQDVQFDVMLQRLGLPVNDLGFNELLEQALPHSVHQTLHVPNGSGVNYVDEQVDATFVELFAALDVKALVLLVLKFAQSGEDD